MDENRIKEVFSDEAFVKGLLELDAPEDVQAALKEKGLDFTVGEIMQLHDAINKAAEKAGEGGELSLDQLDDVAGGLIPFIVAGILLAVIKAAGITHAATKGRW